MSSRETRNRARRRRRAARPTARRRQLQALQQLAERFRQACAESVRALRDAVTLQSQRALELARRCKVPTP